MSIRLAQIYLRDTFPAGKSLVVSSLKFNLRAVGSRLKGEAQAGVQRIASMLKPKAKVSTPTLTALALQIDAGCIRAAPRPDGAGWIAAVAAKVGVPQAMQTHAHAYVTGDDTYPRFATAGIPGFDRNRHGCAGDGAVRWR